MYSKKQILNFISESKPLLQRNFYVKKIGLFGSFAREEQTENSDIDLVIEFEENTENLFDLKIAIKEYFKKALNLEVDICREKFIKPIYKTRILNETTYVK